MKTYILIFYVFIASLLTFSCGSKTAPNSNIATARSAIINNNFPRLSVHSTKLNHYYRIQRPLLLLLLKWRLSTA